MIACRILRAQKTLAAAIGLRLAVVLGLIITAQVVACLYENLSDSSYFARNYVDLEVGLIGRNLRSSGGSVICDTARIPPYYNEHLAPYYAFRVVDATGTVIGESNEQILANIAPPPRVPMTPHSWVSIADTGDWLNIAGGAPWSVDGKIVSIEVATIGDPNWQRFWVLLHELSKDVSIPIFLVILVALPVAILTVRQSLRPLKMAAHQATLVDANDSSFQIDDNNVPLEVATFVAAINRLLAKYHELLSAQRRLVLNTSHELRTPLALMLLELSQMPDDRARYLERDVTGMADLVNRTLQLGRIEAMRSPCREPVNLVEAADEALRSLQPLIEQRHCTIELVVHDEDCFTGDVQSIREATRNLIENAVKHTPTGTRILVTCGPGFVFRVEDSGKGLPTTIRPDQLFEPFRKGSSTNDGVGLGLAIVKKTVELHKGKFDARASELGGACFEIEFPASAKTESDASRSRSAGDQLQEIGAQ